MSDPPKSFEPPSAVTLREMLAQAQKPLNLRLARPLIESLARYVAVLLEENALRNLTTITDPTEAIYRQALEPLLIWNQIRAEAAGGPLVDVGSGGGAPGLPIALAEPGIPVWLVESRETRAAFLENVVRALGVANVQVVAGRAEQLARGALREQAAVAVARALAQPPIALELTLPFVRVGGLVALSVGAGAEGSHPDIRSVAAGLGGGAPEWREAVTPGRPPVRLLIVPKAAPTPENRPRGAAALRRERRRRAGP